MNFETLPFYENEMLFGHDSSKSLVSVEINPKGESVTADLFFRIHGKIERKQEVFQPFLILQNLSLLSGFDREWHHRELAGDNSYRYVIFCPDYPTVQSMLKYLRTLTGRGYGDPYSPYMYYSDLVHQYLMITGKTLFKGMGFEDLLRMQIDIETYCEESYDFPNAERESDRIIIIAMSDSTGWKRIINGREFDEPQMLNEMLKEINLRDPDVIEGHNFHRFDLDYISARAKRHRIKLKMGRDGSVIKSHNSRMNIAERTIVYPKYEIYGRHIIDTWILAQLYDVSARELESYGLKDIARHFKVSPPDRVYIDGRNIPRCFDRNPEMLLKYAGDDVAETEAISRILSPPYFIQAQIFPYSYQNVTVRGNATRIDSLFIREYIHRGYSIPKPPVDRKFQGAYTDIFATGLVKNVLHVDVASLYPSTMLTFKYFPANDNLNVFQSLLGDLREFRLQAKKEARDAQDSHERDFLDALQATFKILINSFYGYLGFSFGHFGDFDMAESVTAKGQEIIRSMVSWLEARQCRLIELDTDGIYFTPPPHCKTPEQEEELVEELNRTLPQGIELELDGRYKAMFSYKMKNYILLDYNDEMYIKGSGLKSRGLELFQRKFIEEMFYLLMTDRKDEIGVLLKKYEDMILKHDWDVTWFQKSESLQESVDTYREKVESGKRNAAAVYELALQSGRDYRAGDQIAYYVTGDKATVTAYKNCRFAYLWDKADPDENIKYYGSKLKSLYKKFSKMF